MLVTGSNSGLGLRQLDTLVVSPMRLAALALPAIRRRGQGRIVNVSSAISHATIAMTGWYQAGKHALSPVTDALRAEVAGDGIDVILVEPGGLDTGICDKAEDDLLRRRAGSGATTPYDRSLKMLRTAHPYMSDPAAAAAVIGRALTDGRPATRYQVGPDVPVVRLVGLLPNRAQDRVLRTVLARRGRTERRADLHRRRRAVEAFLPGPDEAARPVPEVHDIEITVASPQYLLAMKLMAMRFGEDDEDIEILLRQSGLHTAQEALDLVQRMYPQREPPMKTRFFLEEVLRPVRPI